MSRLRKIWLTFRGHWGMYLYVWVQFIVILSIICVEINSLHASYYETYFVEDYEEGMYLYAEVMNHIMADQATTGVGTEEMIQQISEIDGVNGVGYTLNFMSYAVLDKDTQEEALFQGSNAFETKVESPGIFTYVNDTMKNISYRMEDGVWLDKVTESDEYIPVAVGSAVGSEYGVGDVFCLENSVTGKEFQCQVVGVINQYTSTITLDQGGSSKTLPIDSYTPWKIFTNDARVLEGLTEDDWFYPSTCLMLWLEEEYDEAALREYGNIYPLKYMQGCSEESMSIFVNDIFNWYGILIFVILFGLFGSTYLILSKSMYETSVFSLLGMTKKQIASEHIILYGMVYLSSLPVIYIMWSKLTPVIQAFEYWWTSWHVIFLLVMAGVVVGIVTLLCVQMAKKSPKEMMSLAKSMEN